MLRSGRHGLWGPEWMKKPTILRRRINVGTAVIVSFVAGYLILGVFLQAYRLSPRWYSWGGAAVIWCIFVGLRMLEWRNVRRLRREIEQHGGLLRRCMNLRCQYDLRGCSPSGKCPECGTPYSIESLEAFWGTTKTIRMV